MNEQDRFAVAAKFILEFNVIKYRAIHLDIPQSEAVDRFDYSRPS
jgi:hypothetical protein